MESQNMVRERSIMLEGLQRAPSAGKLQKGNHFFQLKILVHLLRTKSGDNENPSYYIKEVSCEELEIRRQAARFVEHHSIDRST